MPNIIASEVDANHVYAKASDGGEVTVTKARVLLFANDLAGSDPDLLHTTVQRQVAQLISDTLGSQNVAPDQIVFDFDPVTGAPTDLEFLG